ncbi:hypothetical protein OG203_18800 [Nocardia sp. NBC_01499]|uniref:hypothetical protein n=1 Tax=Nocardia sp. NBC_01499 TaxID=2903597 RepID=UPI003866B205
MPVTILSAAANTDLDTGSYFELATRVARTCLERSGVAVDEVGMLISSCAIKDNNLVEPAAAALIQKRLGLGLAYAPGRVATLSFDLMHGANGLLHAFTTAECFMDTGEVKYALLLAGDTHPSTERGAAEFPLTASAVAVLLGSSPTAGGFGRLRTVDTTGPVEPSAWLDLNEVGANGRTSGHVKASDDPLIPAAEAVRACLGDEGLDGADFASGRAVLLVPAPVPGFPARLAATLGLAPESVVGVDPALGDPYSAAPVHAYLNAKHSGVLDAANTVLFLAAYDASAACVAYHPGLPATATASAVGAQGTER